MNYFNFSDIIDYRNLTREERIRLDRIGLLLNKSNDLSIKLSGYTNILFVSTEGNDNGFELGNPIKPMRNIKSASLYLSVLQSGTSNKYLVYVNKGIYEEEDVAYPDIDIYFERDAIVYCEGNGVSDSVITDWNHGAGNYRIYGLGRFYCHNTNPRTIRFFRTGTKFYIEAEETDCVNIENNASGIDVQGIVTAPKGYRCNIISYSTVQSQGFRMKWINCNFTYSWHQVGRFQNDRCMLEWDNCTFFVNNTIYPLGASEPTRNAYDSQGNQINKIDSNPLLLAPSNEWVTYLDPVSLTQQQIIDSTANNLHSALYIRLINTSTDEATIIIKNCTFEIFTDRFIGIKIAQTVNNAKATVIIENCYIRDRSGGTETVAVAAVMSSEFDNKIIVKIQGLQANTDVRFGIPSSFAIPILQGQQYLESLKEFTNDAAASTNGVAIGEYYYNTTSNVVTKRQS